MISWEKAGSAGSYEVWRSQDDGRDVWNVSDGSEPSNEAGYYDLEALLRLKGLKLDDFVPEPRGHGL